MGIPSSYQIKMKIDAIFVGFLFRVNLMGAMEIMYLSIGSELPESTESWIHGTITFE